MSAAQPARGLFLSFEGVEGSGKTTQVVRLETALRERGRDVFRIREPGGTDFSERMRELLLHWVGPPLQAWSELCLYVAARAQLVDERIRPALERGVVVLADRYGEASVAYQGGGRRLGARRVRALNRWATGDLRPDRIFLLDLDPGVGLRRIRTRREGVGLDRLESEPLAFHQRVRATYLQMARAEPGRFRILDAAGPEDEIARQILTEVLPLL